MDLTGVDQLRAVLRIESIQIIHMLEIVRIEFFAVDNIVRLYIIREFSNLKVITLLSKERLRKLQDLRVGSGGSGNRNRLSLICKSGHRHNSQNQRACQNCR